MKRIITIFLIMLILFVIGLIIINKLEQPKNNENNNDVKNNNVNNNLTIREHFDTTTGPTTQNREMIDDDGLIHKINVDSEENKFFTIPETQRGEDCTTSRDCTTVGDCDDGQLCENLNDGLKCYTPVNETAYELESDKEGYITIENNNIDNFTFSFSFMLKNADTKKCLLYAESGLWSIENENDDLFLLAYGSGNSVNKVRINNNNGEINCYKYYKFTINTTGTSVRLNFNGQPNSTEITLKLPSCTTSNDCLNGECVGRTNRVCKNTTELYTIGKKRDEYYDMYVGELKIIDNQETSTCNFYGKGFENKRLCLETCKNSFCDDTVCESECKDTPQCEFEALGRHSMDCIQECVKNEDCTSDFCVKKCNECSPNCPWDTRNDDTSSFDSQYFDPQGKPSPLKLSLNTISTDGTTIFVNWERPYEGKTKIKGYISYLYKTFNKAEGTKINKIDSGTKNCREMSVDREKVTICEHTLYDLTPNETYTLGIKSYNDIGLSKISNLITFKASIATINMDLSIEDEVDDYDVGDYNYCNVY